jgi:hypothetical protein
VLRRFHPGHTLLTVDKPVAEYDKAITITVPELSESGTISVIGPGSVGEQDAFAEQIGLDAAEHFQPPRLVHRSFWSIRRRGSQDPAEHLEELARVAVLVALMDAWQAITVHTAVIAGATLHQLSSVLGKPAEAVVRSGVTAH